MDTFFADLVDGAAWLLRILWATRVSVINVASSVLLFWYAIPAQNLMADRSFAGSFFEIPFWFLVFFSTFFFWAFPVHYGARRTLEDDAWIISRRLRDELPAHSQARVVAAVRDRHGLSIDWIPRLLGVMPFVALALGIYGALSAVRGAAVLPESLATVRQGHWLYAADLVSVVLFVIFVYFRRRYIAAMMDHLKDRLEAFYYFAFAVTTAVYAFAYIDPLAASVALPRALLVPPLFGSLVLAFSFLQRLGNRGGVPVLTLVCCAAGALTGLNVAFNDLRWLQPSGGDQRVAIDQALKRWKHANGCDTGPCPAPLIVAIDGGASRAAFTAATFIGDMLDRLPKPGPGAIAAPGRLLFAISGVSGGAYGAAVIQAAIADGQLQSNRGAPPCGSARSTWFGYEAWMKAGGTFTWRQCLQALTSGDYLSSAIIGLAFRDLAAPPWQWIGLPIMKDRAGLLEQSWERHYAAILEPRPATLGAGEAADGARGEGLRRRAAHPLAFLDAPGAPTRWMPMLLLNSTSVTSGRRVVSSDLVSRSNQADDKGGALFPQAYDLREAMAEPCPITTTPIPLPTEYPSQFLAKASREARDAETLSLGACGKPAAVEGHDIRLSTAALTSARFPVISPAGAFGMSASRYGDLVVDGGYFENSGLTTALDIVAAVRDMGVEPVLLSIANDPEDQSPSNSDLGTCGGNRLATPAADCAGLPRRLAETPLLLPPDDCFLKRVFGLVYRPIQAVSATRDGHAAEAMNRAEQSFPKGGFFRLKVDKTPDFAGTPGVAPADTPGCDRFLNTKLTMPDVSMSWWLSASVQADLDAQLCSSGNRAVMATLLTELSRR